MVEWWFDEVGWLSCAVDANGLGASASGVVMVDGGSGGAAAGGGGASRTNLVAIIVSHRPGESCLATTDRRCGAAGHRLTVSGPTETKVDVVVRRLDISRSSTPATGVCGVAELYGTTLVPTGSAHEFAGVL